MKKHTSVVCLIIIMNYFSSLIFASNIIKQVKYSQPAKDSVGPTILLGYDKNHPKENPLNLFMYFTKLISPTLVIDETSTGNTQKAVIVSYESIITSDKFCVKCKFEVSGQGYQKNIFDSSETIKWNITKLKKNKKPLRNIINYVKLDGQCSGSIEISGNIVQGKKSVNEININFNENDESSPVSIGLYSIKPNNGKYHYEERVDEMIVKINTLTFRRTDGVPKMEIKLDAISKKGKKSNFLSKIKGTIANLLIKPLEVDELGNETMLELGYALVKQESEFTFPKARDSYEDRKIHITKS